jgi:ATP-dependent DNA helicase RecQ
MIKFSANYSNTNHNFVIQNLENKQAQNEYLSAVCVLQNLLQRGTPTLMSEFLMSKIGVIQDEETFKNCFGLISNEVPKWSHTIKGDDVTGDNPAHTFFYDIIPEYLPEYTFIQQLILPEAQIDDIIQSSSEFENQAVDFYLPQAALVIEIDGEQHKNIADQTLDTEREVFLNRYSIKTIRIKTKDIRYKTADLKTQISQIKEHLLNFNGVFKFYKDNFHSYSKINEEIISQKLLPTSVVRFQITILKLIESGRLKIGTDWKIFIQNHDISNYEELAIKDILIWLKSLLILQQIELPDQKYSVQVVDSLGGNCEVGAVKIDFSLLRRWTDENESQKDIVFVRTDYLDKYPRLVNKKIVKDTVNYFKVNTLSKPIEYKLEEKKEEEILGFFLKNIFGYEKFNEGQAKIIGHALRLKDTIGLLPTSSGKSLCYQMAVLLQPSISFVVCPLKSLMRDQIMDLKNSFFIDRVGFVSSDQGAEEKDFEQDKFSKGKYFFIIISPERFQTTAFRDYFDKVSKENSVAYAVIDEVHCLSEWGHDFRPAYLNLSDTIKKYAKEYVYIGLTATASLHVLKDIQTEFDINDEGVKTNKDFTRKNLEFSVIDDKGNKEEALIAELSRFKNENVFENLQKKTKCGMIFTPYASTQSGLVSRLNKVLDFNYKDDWRVREYNGKIDDETKKKIQDDFKKNRFPLLVATKAFGMGINKTNVRYTIHYGIPASMEALYQEAGRAGRDNQSANNYVLLSKETDENELEMVFDPNSSYEEVEEIQKQAHREHRDHDVYKQLYLWIKSNNTIDDEVNLMLRIYKVVNESKNVDVIINTRDYVLIDERGRVERAIYRLKQLGIISDWLVENFGIGTFIVKKTDYNDRIIEESLLEYIQKYEKEFSLDRYAFIEKSNMPLSEKCMRILLHWSYDNFSYKRRESLKNMYELSSDFVDGKIDAKGFKNQLESYFRMNEETGIFQSIADDQELNYKLWFKPFYKKSVFITKDRLVDLRSNIMRFLESYRDDIGLNLVSGLIRLSLDDYDDTDGRNRLEDSLNRIVENHPEVKKHLFNELIKFAVNLNQKNQEELADSMCKYYYSRNDFLTIYNKLESDIALQHYLISVNNQLIKVNSEIYDKLKLK